MSTKVDKPSAVFRVSQYLQLQDTKLAERAANQLITRKKETIWRESGYANAKE